jgi:tight adherence protein C
MLLIAAAFVAAFTLIAGLGLAFFYRDAAARRLSSLMMSPADSNLLTQVTVTPPAERIRKIVQPFQKVLPRSEAEVSQVRKRLACAGYREDTYVNVYYGIRVLIPLMLCVLVTITGVYRLSPLFSYVCAAGFGYLIPDFILGRLISSRRFKLRLGLPEALDLIVICVEAGLSLDKAVSRAAQELQLSQPEMADEMNLVGLEQRAGRPRADAWTHCAERTGVDTIKALSAILIQADRFGTSIGKALRAHADALRTHRRQEAEERAHKTTVKLVFPLVLFIFPSLFVVTLGPSMITMFAAFDKYLN